MRKPWDVITALESDNSRIAKETLIKQEAGSKNDDFFQGVKLALDSLISFGVKQVPVHGGPDGQGLPSAVFFKLVEQLQNRELTGNDARNAIELCLKTATRAEWNNWYRRILIKDLRCGVSEKTVNNAVKKLCPQYSVPVFTVQLAKDIVGEEHRLVGKKLIDVKLDGVRLISIVYPTGRVDQFSRNGKEIINYPHIKNEFSIVSNTLSEPMVFDGEVVSSSFQDLMKQLYRKDDVETSDAKLQLFDILPLSEFENGSSTLNQSERSMYLRDWVSQHSFKSIDVIGQELVDLDTLEGNCRFKEINKSAIDGGFEGIMIKDPYALYELKRSYSWMKLKPFIEVSLDITGVEEGEKDLIGTLGALTCSGIDDEKQITVNVGGGYSLKLRAQIWANYTKKPVQWTHVKNKELITETEYPDGSDLIGRIIEIRADSISQNRDGTFSLRFPRFRRFRGFEPGEKL